MLLLGDIGLDNVRRLQTIHSVASLPPRSLRCLVGNGLNIALHSRTLKSRNDRTKPKEEPTNEQGRGDDGGGGPRFVRPTLLPSSSSSGLSGREGEKRKVKLGPAATASEMSDPPRPPSVFLIALASF